jgi:nitroreductase
MHVHFSQPITDIIEQRFSCRAFVNTPIAEEKRRDLAGVLSTIKTGPLGAPLRFELLAATEEDRSALSGLGTYGFISGNTGFIAGAVGAGERNLEDYGYRLEEIVLYASSIGLGTCWLGGSFTRSSFASRIALSTSESIPAVIAVGYPSDRRTLMDRLIRRVAAPSSRLAWEQLFSDGSFGTALSTTAAERYATPLKMVQLGPSASNKQPWRVLKQGADWHFYLRRTPAYSRRRRGALGGVDMQRVDMGIAMSHFELTAAELGLGGTWAIQDPGIELTDELTQYSVTWREEPTTGQLGDAT